MVYKQKGSENWWYKFTWNGKQIRESTKCVWPSDLDPFDRALIAQAIAEDLTLITTDSIIPGYAPTVRVIR